MGPRRSSLRAFAGRYVIAFVAATAVMVGAVVGVNTVINQKIDRIPRVQLVTAPVPPGGENFLLLGSDTRAFVNNQTQKDAFGDASKEPGARSDTLMIVHVEPSAERTLVVSFPRDLWVSIPGQGMGKINAAFNSGPQAVIDMLKADFDIPVQHYLDVNFESFRGIVDAIGRVPIYFPYPARDLKTGLHFFVGGCLPLSGTQALEYVRSRYLEFYNPIAKKWSYADAVPDIGRIQRQQDFIRKLTAIAVQESLSNPLTANDVADEVVNNLQADASLNKDDVLALVDAFRTINPDDTSSLQFETLPWKPGPNQRGQQVLYVDDAKAEPILAQLRDFNGAAAAPKVVPSDVRLTVLNGSGKNGAAQGALTELEKLGYVGVGARNNPTGRIAQTEVRYASGQDAKGKLVLKYLDPQAKLVPDTTIQGSDVVVVLGTDFVGVVLQPGATGATAATTPTTAATTPAGGTTATTAPAFVLPGAAPRNGC